MSELKPPSQIQQLTELQRLLGISGSRELKLLTRIKKLERALEKSKELIEGEYCSHVGSSHSANNEHCYANFIYEALLRDEELK